MPYDIEKEIELFREKLEQEDKTIIVGGRKLYSVTSSQILDFLKKLENDSINLTQEEKISKYNNILLKFDDFYIVGDFKYQGIFPCIIFSNSIFAGNVAFKNTVFTGESIFSNVEFNGGVEFINIEFVFNSPALFNNIKFISKSAKIKFINIKMTFLHLNHNRTYIVFSNAEFNGHYVIFENIICGEIDFEDAKFLTTMEFNNIKCEVANFKGITAKEYIIFNKIEANRRVDFNDSQIDNIAFGGIKFHEVNFSNNKFKYFQLSHVEVNEIAHFNGVKFSENIDFSKNITFNQADFSNATFKKKANFAHCTFNAAPLFHEAVLHQDTSFEGAKFLKCETDEDYRAYRTLKQHMNSVHATLEESRFFALEQRTRQHLDIQELKSDWKNKLYLLPNIIISQFYSEISSYGQSTFMPIAWLVFFWFMFGLGIYSLPDMIATNDEYIKNSAAWVNQYPKGFGYALQNIVNPFSIFAKDIPFYAKNNWAIFFGHIQSLFSLAFITLWLFAVRRRFQKGE